MTQEEKVNGSPRTRHSSEHMFPDVSQSYIFVVLFAALLAIANIVFGVAIINGLLVVHV